MLNLDDFSRLFVAEFSGEKIDGENSESYYKAKIEEMKRYYESLIEKEKKEYFQKGYEKAKQDMKKAYLENLENDREKLKKSTEIEMRNLKKEFKTLVSLLREENVKLGRRVLQAVSESLEDIFEFLFIKEENLPFIKEKLKEIIEDFSLESEPISVDSSEKFLQILKDIDGLKLKIDDDLKPGDFVVKFKDFAVVHSIKDKLGLLREEIEREIKKSSKI